MTTRQDLDGLLATATRLAQRQAAWGGWEADDPRCVDATVMLLPLVSEGYDEAHLERLVNAFGAVGRHLPDDPRWLLQQTARGHNEEK